MIKKNNKKKYKGYECLQYALDVYKGKHAPNNQEEFKDMIYHVCLLLQLNRVEDEEFHFWIYEKILENKINIGNTYKNHPILCSLPDYLFFDDTLVLDLLKNSTRFINKDQKGTGNA